MAEDSLSRSTVQCMGCGRELSAETQTCPFCGQVLDRPAADGGDAAAGREEGPGAQAEEARPIDPIRFALAGTSGLLAALGAGYVWFLIASNTEREFALVALFAGLIVGLMVAWVSEGSLATPYRLLGAILAAGSVAFGQFLIYARPQTSFYFEFGAVVLLIYGVALFEGWQAPSYAARRGLIRFGLVHESNQRRLLAGSALLLAVALVAGAGSGLLVGPAAVQAKIHASQAVNLIEAGETDAAISQLELALEKEEAYPDAHLFLGLLESDRFALLEAREHLDRALELGIGGEGFTLAHYHLSLIHWVSGDNPAALAHLDQAIESGIEYDDALLVRASLHMDGGDQAAAEADLNQALSRNLSADDEAWARDLLEELQASD